MPHTILKDGQFCTFSLGELSALLLYNPSDYSVTCSVSCQGPDGTIYSPVPAAGSIPIKSQGVHALSPSMLTSADLLVGVVAETSGTTAGPASPLVTGQVQDSDVATALEARSDLLVVQW